MADTKISAESAASALGGTEAFVGVQSAANVKVTATQIKTWTSSAPTITGHPVVEGVTSTGATGTGKFVFDGTPTLVTPVLGVATVTSVNKVAITAPATSATLTIADGKTATVNNSLTLAGTDSTTMTFPTTSATIARTDAANTFTGVQTMTSPVLTTPAVGVATGTSLALNGATLGTAKLAITGSVANTPSTLTDGATPALDASLGNIFTLAAAGDRTIAVPSNPSLGQKIVIRHLASGGARTLALNTGAGGFRYGSDITGLTQTASGKTDYIGAIWNSVDSFWDVIAYAKGY